MCFSMARKKSCTRAASPNCANPVSTHQHGGSQPTGRAKSVHVGFRIEPEIARKLEARCVGAESVNDTARRLVIAAL